MSLRLKIRPVSQQTQELIIDLHNAIGRWNTIFNNGAVVAILTRIGETDQPAAIVQIVPFLLSNNHNTINAAALAVTRLLAHAQPTDLIWLDSAIRSNTEYLGGRLSQWNELSSLNVEALADLGESSLSVLGILSFHRNGFVREKAVEMLASLQSRDTISFLLLRLNDWVKNVCQSACRALGPLITPSNSHSFISNLVLISRVERSGRAGHTATIEAIKALLSRPECFPALQGGMAAPDLFVRRESFRLAIESNNDKRTIFNLAFCDRDNLVRLSAARSAPSVLNEDMLSDFLPRMKTDRFMPVRREGFRTIYSRFPARALDEALNALFDPHTSIREEARYLLRNESAIDFRRMYRNSLTAANSSIRYAAIAGLGETGVAEDDALLIEFANIGFPKMRIATIKALAHLNADAHMNLFLSALGDPTSSISAIARKVLASRAMRAGGETLWELFNSSPHVHVRRNVAKLFARLNKWDRLYYSIMSLKDCDKLIIEICSNIIASWPVKFNRDFTQPTTEQLTRIEQALSENADQIEGSIRQQLFFFVRGR